MHLQILISAPNDQSEEVEIALQAVQQLNDFLEVHGHSISAKHWQKNISTGRADRAQEVINDQTKDCDAIVAIIGPRLGTPTGEYDSGTVEEIYKFLERSSPSEVSYDIHVFFNAKDLGNPLEINARELERVQQFRASLNEKGISFAQFSSNDILRNLVQLGLNTLVGKSKPFVDPEEADPLEEFDELGSDDASEIAAENLSAASNALTQMAASIGKSNEKLSALNQRVPTDPSDTKAIKVFLSDLASALDESRRDLDPIVDEMRARFDQSYAYLSLAVTIVIEDAVLSDGTPDFSELSSTITSTADVISNAHKTFSETQSKLAGIPRRTKELRKSKKGLHSVYDKILNALESFEQDYRSLIDTINH